MSGVPHTAVVLAAGRGTRLGARGQAHPKGFIAFDDGVPLIEQSMAKMRAAGVARIVLVTGHLHAHYDALAARWGAGVEVVHNPLHAHSGSMHSLYQARERVHGPFWLFESDLLYERAALDALAAAGAGSAILTSGPTGSADEVYVEATPEGTLRNLSKDRTQLGRVHGELVGISRIEPDCFAVMLRHAAGVFERTAHLEYEQALVAAARTVAVRCPLLPDLAWTEIDTEAHWLRARDRVRPLVAGARRGAGGAMKAWHAVWSRRDAPRDGDPLQTLIDLDGFDAGAGRIAAANWRAYAAQIADRLGVAPGQQVYEVGCGAGAFVYALRERGVRVGGLDYAENLVARAREAMPEADFHAGEAADLPLDPPVDFAIANSVFHYFPDTAYSERVVRRMLDKARHGIAVLEVPDLARRDEAEAVRRAHLTPEAYEAKYRGLAHLYHARGWFEALAARCGCRCEITDQSIAHYAQSAFRFNCLMFK